AVRSRTGQSAEAAASEAMPRVQQGRVEKSDAPWRTRVRGMLVIAHMSQPGSETSDDFPAIRTIDKSRCLVNGGTDRSPRRYRLSRSEVRLVSEPGLPPGRYGGFGRQRAVPTPRGKRDAVGGAPGSVRVGGGQDREAPCVGSEGDQSEVPGDLVEPVGGAGEVEPGPGADSPFRLRERGLGLPAGQRRDGPPCVQASIGSVVPAAVRAARGGRREEAPPGA